jgi:hypothetical protein
MNKINKNISRLILAFFVVTFSLALGQGVWANCNCFCSDASIRPRPYTEVSTDDACRAWCSNTTNNSSMDEQNPCSSNPITSPSGSSGNSISIKNPLSPDGKAIEPEVLYARIISALLAFVGVASLVAFVYAGFVFLASAGNPERVKKAKDTMLYAVIGIFVAMASYALLSFVFKTLEGATGN